MKPTRMKPSEKKNVKPGLFLGNIRDIARGTEYPVSTWQRFNLCREKFCKTSDTRLFKIPSVMLPQGLAEI